MAEITIVVGGVGEVVRNRSCLALDKVNKISFWMDLIMRATLFVVLCSLICLLSCCVMERLGFFMMGASFCFPLAQIYTTFSGYYDATGVNVHWGLSSRQYEAD